MRMKKISKRLESLFFFFPAFHLLMMVLSAVSFIRNPSLVPFLIFLQVTYLMPIFIWRIVVYFYPIDEGFASIGKKAKGGNLWLISNQLQFFYNGFSLPEVVLKMIPGAYSAWLRMWGSKIGKKITWTPNSTIVDRPYLVIGDRCLIGGESYISAHAIKKNEGAYTLYVKKVLIEDDCVISYHVTISPGVKMGKKSFVAAGGVLNPNVSLEEGESFARFQELTQ